MPRQPDPVKTMLIMASLTPKSEMIMIGTFAATASSAAVDDTVTSPTAPSRASDIDPLRKDTAPGASRPVSTSAASNAG